MDYIPKIISLVTTIHSHLQKVKKNKKQCQRLGSRIEMLMVSVKMVQNTNFLDKINKVLKELEITLQNAEALVRSFTSRGSFTKVIKAAVFCEKFEHINDRLNDAAQQLMLALQVSLTQIQSTFQEKTRKMEDKKDREQDKKSDKEDVKAVEEDSAKEKASHPPVDMIRMINMSELKKDSKPFLEADTYKYYKGVFLKQSVAIKRFTSDSANLSKVQNIFLREAETMNQFRSNNIVHIYGICMNREAHKSEFLIVMEHCENGTLKKVLGGEQPLSWPTRVRMSLDTARGVYWLHQSQKKARLHCSVSSTSFLVNEDYRVKLAGLELTKTETSIRRNNSKKTGSASTTKYLSPQQLDDINYHYNKECEVYSLGIVLWEISSRKAPFEGVDLTEFRRKVVEDKVREPLPADCPQALVELIDECRAFDPFERPSAGAVVDRLLQIQDQCRAT
uniref:mixed lineage kinase domain-like protein n=1 Tax=Pristiophorus japonicus TaxID=55135 RepID=UPI00398F7E7C